MRVDPPVFTIGLRFRSNSILLDSATQISCIWRVVHSIRCDHYLGSVAFISYDHMFCHINEEPFVVVSSKS